MRKWAKEVAVIFAVVFVVLSLATPRDSTDGPGFWRSGMILHIDAATGCHYLRRPLTGLTPRLNASGQHVCTGQDGEDAMMAADR